MKTVVEQTIQRCQKDDIPKLMELFKTVYEYNPNFQDPKFFDWQFLNILI